MPRSTKLYVGNLPKDSNENTVRDLFSRFGEVVECDIIKNFGFVHFSDSNEALKAVEQLNDKEWNGSTLKVQTSHSKVHTKPGMGNRGECYRCGNVGHLCMNCPTLRTRRDIKGGDIQEKTSTTLNNISKEISAMTGSIGGLYSFINNYSGNINRYRDTNSYKDSSSDDFHQTTYPKDWQRNNYNGDQSSRYHHSNSDDYNSDKYTSINRRNSYYDNYPPPPVAPSRYRHQPYPTASERWSAASSSVSNSNARPSSSLPSLYSLSSSHPGRNNSNDRDANPYFRPPPEYYEHRRRTDRRSHEH